MVTSEEERAAANRARISADLAARKARGQNIYPSIRRRFPTLSLREAVRALRRFGGIRHFRGAGAQEAADRQYHG